MTETLSAEILVCGGGPSGFGAAVSAARSGAKVVLVERYGFLGGAATAALVNPFMVSKFGGKFLVKGIFEEVVSRLSEKKACSEGSLFDQPHIVFDPEVLKYTLFSMAEEAGVKLLLHSSVCGAITNDSALKGVAVTGKSGDQHILSQVTVDASGDGDIAYLAGCRFEKGRPSDGLTQPMTMMFRIAGIDMSKMPPREEIDLLFKKAKEEKTLRTPRENFLWFKTTRQGEIHVNSTRVPGADGTSAADLTKAEIEGRKQVENLFGFLKEKVPGFESSYISQVAPQIGVRETRRIMGGYVLTGEDVISGRKFDDPVASSNYPIDIHSPDGRSTTFQKLGPGIFYEIPYRCLVPEKIDGLLVTGRSISVTHEALSSARVMPTCMALGQAAGATAAIALKKNIRPRKVDYNELRRALNEQGADIRC